MTGPRTILPRAGLFLPRAVSIGSLYSRGMATRSVRTDGPAETEALGAELASALADGDLVLVRGDLGAGKTTLVRGAARALGVSDPVTSPTFSIGHRYKARAAGDGPADPHGLTVSHLDLFRLAGLGEEEPEMLADYVGPGRIAFVEWAPEGEPELAAARFVVTLAHGGGDARLVEVEEPVPAGGAGSAR